MPITPSTLAHRKKAVSFDYQGDTVNLEYYPAMLASDTADQLKGWIAKANAAETDEATEAVLLDFGAWVCTLLASWDYLEDDNATMQPITPENIAAQVKRFPDFIMQVLVAIVQDRALGNANGTPTSGFSGDTSLPTEKSNETEPAASTSAEASQNPSVLSLSPDGLAAEAPPSNG